jgi:hypothetical protein
VLQARFAGRISYRGWPPLGVTMPDVSYEVPGIEAKLTSGVGTSREPLWLPLSADRSDSDTRS